eukprot:TRINITY_DN8004_c0_g1_i2.p1 TRINITY_DN8004_c0_g1~~TRINITY_DN8004_c0_g1_i2.p1  ORF type:complete len:228 (-),score=39.22 TRINITY_DN8004_c0_g1_i2:108-791(-)
MQGQRMLSWTRNQKTPLDIANTICNHNQSDAKNLICLKNLKDGVTEVQLEKVLRNYGKVMFVQLNSNTISAIVKMENAQQITNLLSTTSFELESLFDPKKNVCILPYEGTLEDKNLYSIIVNAVPLADLDIQNELPRQNMSMIETLKANWENFKKQPLEQRKNVLGQLLYPFIEKDVGKDLAPNITRKLLEFEFMTEEDVIECVEENEDVHRRIERALRALEEVDLS